MIPSNGNKLTREFTIPCICMSANHKTVYSSTLTRAILLQTTSIQVVVSYGIKRNSNKHKRHKEQKEYEIALNITHYTTNVHICSTAYHRWIDGNECGGYVLHKSISVVSSIFLKHDLMLQFSFDEALIDRYEGMRWLMSRINIKYTLLVHSILNRFYLCESFVLCHKYSR